MSYVSERIECSSCRNSAGELKLHVRLWNFWECGGLSRSLTSSDLCTFRLFSGVNQSLTQCIHPQLWTYILCCTRVINNNKGRTSYFVSLIFVVDMSIRNEHATIDVVRRRILLSLEVSVLLILTRPPLADLSISPESDCVVNCVGISLLLRVFFLELNQLQTGRRHTSSYARQARVKHTRLNFRIGLFL